MDGDLILSVFRERAPYWGPRQIQMHELIIGPGDGASLSMTTWKGGPFTGDFDGKAQKTREMGISRFRGPFREPV